MHDQLEKLCTAERMLDDNINGDMIVDTIGLKFSDKNSNIGSYMRNTSVDPQYWEILGQHGDDEQQPDSERRHQLNQYE